MAAASVLLVGCSVESVELYDVDSADDVMDLEGLADLAADLDMPKDQDLPPDLPQDEEMSAEPEPPSCVGADRTCGPSMSESCCASRLVPGNAAGAEREGQSFHLDFDEGTFLYNERAWPAAVSDFRLDTYEVTVRRFRAFLDDYDRWRASGRPRVNEGGWALRPRVGWLPEWPLEATADSLRLTLSCANHQTWTDEPGIYEDLPITCANWYQAQAFCLWDGGRLPTETEWMYAAAGGTEQRAFPWSDPARSTAIDASFANYSCEGDDDIENCAVTDILPPGSRPRDLARWGHRDMAGNLSEWVHDGTLAERPYPGQMDVLCVDCVTPVTPDGSRVVRGGNYRDVNPNQLRTPHRTTILTLGQWHFGNVGFRCARAPAD